MIDALQQGIYSFWSLLEDRDLTWLSVWKVHVSSLLDKEERITSLTSMRSTSRSFDRGNRWAEWTSGILLLRYAAIWRELGILFITLGRSWVLGGSLPRRSSSVSIQTSLLCLSCGTDFLKSVRPLTVGSPKYRHRYMILPTVFQQILKSPQHRCSTLTCGQMTKYVSSRRTSGRKLPV